MKRKQITINIEGQALPVASWMITPSQWKKLCSAIQEISEPDRKRFLKMIEEENKNTNDK